MQNTIINHISFDIRNILPAIHDPIRPEELIDKIPINQYLEKANEINQLKQNLVACSFILPNLLGFALFTLVPITFSLVLALMNWDGANEITWAGLDNFKRLLSDTTFRISLFNTFYYVIGTVPPTMAAALGLALLLNQRLRGRNFFRTTFFFPDTSRRWERHWA